MKTSMKFRRALARLDLEPIIFNLVVGEDGPHWTRQQATAMESWYRRYHFMLFHFPHKTIVPTKKVDTFWHYHILDTDKYARDCQLLHGKFIHHFPYFGARGETDRRALEAAFKETEQLYLDVFRESPRAVELSFWPRASGGSVCGKCGGGQCRGTIDTDTRPRLHRVAA